MKANENSSDAPFCLFALRALFSNPASGDHWTAEDSKSGYGWLLSKKELVRCSRIVMVILHPPNWQYIKYITGILKSMVPENIWQTCMDKQGPHHS